MGKLERDGRVIVAEGGAGLERRDPAELWANYGR